MFRRRNSEAGSTPAGAKPPTAAPIMGGKYPHLCYMIDLLLEPDSRFIHIVRPIEESVHSLAPLG